MFKFFKRRLVLSASLLALPMFFIALVLSTPALAGGDEVMMLKERVKELEANQEKLLDKLDREKGTKVESCCLEIESLKKRISDLNEHQGELFHSLEEAKSAGDGSKISDLDEHHGKLYHSLEEKKNIGHGSRISDSLSLGGLIEVDAFFDDAEADSSDIVGATVELAITADINEKVKGHILLLWEEDATDPIAIDEATIEISSNYGMSLTVGKIYVPFGQYNSHMITDPQTLELGETNESAIIATYARGIFTGSAGVFNGDVDENKENHIDDYVFSLGVVPADGVTIGVSYISDIAESDKDISGLAGGGVLIDTIAGASAFVSLQFGVLSLDAEVLGALEAFNDLDVDHDHDHHGDKPVTFNLEAAYQVKDNLELAARYEGNDEFFVMPERSFGVVANYQLFHHTTLSAEYLWGDFAENGKKDLTVFTTELAIEF